jgi:hypothetical protein
MPTRTRRRLMAVCAALAVLVLAATGLFAFTEAGAAPWTG